MFRVRKSQACTRVHSIPVVCNLLHYFLQSTIYMFNIIMQYHMQTYFYTCTFDIKTLLLYLLRSHITYYEFNFI